MMGALNDWCDCEDCRELEASMAARVRTERRVLVACGLLVALLMLAWRAS